MSKHTEKSFMTRLKTARLLRTFFPILQYHSCLFFVCIILASGIKQNCLANALHKTCTNERCKRPTAGTEGTFTSAYERATQSL